jgi:hypothetical protein
MRVNNCPFISAAVSARTATFCGSGSGPFGLPYCPDNAAGSLGNLPQSITIAAYAMPTNRSPRASSREFHITLDIGASVPKDVTIMKMAIQVLGNSGGGGYTEYLGKFYPYDKDFPSGESYACNAEADGYTNPVNPVKTYYMCANQIESTEVWKGNLLLLYYPVLLRIRLTSLN